MKISILGAGIGGLSSAIALKQKGFDVDLYERDPAVRNIGAGIVCWPNASFVLDEFKLLDKIRRVSGQPASMDRVSHLGEPLGSLDIRQINQLMGYDSFSILRRDLMDILVSRVRELGIDIHYSHELTGFETVESGKVLARFANGNTTLSEILIGADGRMNSISRRFICCDNQPVYQNFINWIGVFESREETFTDQSVKDFWGVGERFGIVPVNATTAYWAGGVAASRIGSRDPELFKSELFSVFENWPDPIPRIIRETSCEAINKIYVHDHSPVDVWHKDNVLMIGDAAHAPLPTSGQGACQALEDAWHLANLLEDEHLNIMDMFSRFVKLRYTKTAGIIMSGRQLASALFNVSPDFCKQRNENSKRTDFDNVAAGMARSWMEGLPPAG